MESLLDGLARNEIQRLWQEYERDATPEAQFVREMNLIDVCLQALKYEQEHRYDPSEENDHFIEYEHLDEFFQTTGQRLRSRLGARLFNEIENRYQHAKVIALRRS